MRYLFEEVQCCEMCGSDKQYHKIMGQRMNCSQGLSPKKNIGISVTVLQCNSCKLIYSSPMPIPFDINDHYGVPPENYWKESYFKHDPKYFETQLDTLSLLQPIKPGLKALDVGAGVGKCMLNLSIAGYDTFGFEPSEPFYERAISKMNIPKEKLKLGKIEDVDYEENSFDFITFGAVVEHLYHPAACIKKALSWLKPGGIIQIEVPNAKHLISKLINRYFNYRGGNCVTNLSPMHSPFHLYEFDLESFNKLGEKLNFKVVKHHYDVCELFFIPKFLHFVFNKYMQHTNSGLQLTVWLKK